MATISSHILNALNGTHAAGVRVQLMHIKSNTLLFDTQTDESGRVSISVLLPNADPDDDYDLIIFCGKYWLSQNHHAQNASSIRTVVLRFTMPNSSARYHMPVILSPNSYSCWCSAPE